MVHHLISNPIEVLTPSRDGKVVVRYQSGERKIVDVGELWADGGIREVSQAIGRFNGTWDFSNWQDPDKWHNGALETPTFWGGLMDKVEREHIEEWHAIIDALKTRGYKATLEGGGAACPYIGIQLDDGRYVTFGDVDDVWTGNLYADWGHGFEGGDVQSNIVTDVSSDNRDAEAIADGFERAFKQTEEASNG